jgi:23S rRNA (cytidine1920-2'-O)/16S rRNA (cytidine1409-2'-O)-methyltransferase
VAKSPRVRLDQLLVERDLATTRSLARALIMAGDVEVMGVVVDKAGAPVAADAEVRLRERPRFVSRAGEKLAHALDVFGLDVAGRRALDVGASTGGFVDCLLQRGAVEVVALDVGYGQLDQRVRVDGRVHVMERVNARYLTADQLPYAADLLTADVSFISLEKVLPAVVATLAPAFDAVVLVKPQFEAGRARVGKGGIVRDAAVHRDVLVRFTRFVASAMGLDVYGAVDSGLPGTGGNREFVVRFGRGGAKGLSLATLESAIDGLTEQNGSDDAEARGDGGT